LLGLQPPTSGDVLVNGVHLDASDRKDMARHIQPIFQDPFSSLNPRKTLRQIIKLPLIVHGIDDSKTWDKKVEQMLDVVGLPKRVIDNYPNELAGGQRHLSRLIKGFPAFCRSRPWRLPWSGFNIKGGKTSIRAMCCKPCSVISGASAR
jgi:ABC-type microcin C transport system duplicated ATPase subunit YejF